MLRRSLCVSALVVASTFGFASTAKAQVANEDVFFNGVVGQVCSLQPQGSGVLVPIDNDTVLSSSAPGTGVAVNIFCNDDATITVGTPVPLGDTPTAGITLASSLELDGETTNDGDPGVSAPAATTDLQAIVDMTASSATTLPTGGYVYSVTVTATPD